jgi:hypothetical protein
MKGKGYEERMEGLFSLNRMAAGGGVFDEDGKVLPSTSSMIMRMNRLPLSAESHHTEKFLLRQMVSGFFFWQKRIHPDQNLIY